MLREWSDLPEESDRRAARTLFAELERLSSRLKQVEGELKRLTGQDIDRRLAAMPGVAALLLKARKQRNKLLPNLFGEPAWDMLLALASLPGGGAEPALSIGYAAEVPPTTALRYLALLETAGLIERTENPEDRRSTLVRLTPLGREKVTQLLEPWPMALVVFALLPAIALIGSWLG